MKRLWTVLPAGIVLASTVLIGAQAPSQQPPADRPAATPPASEQRTAPPAEPKTTQTTVSGCLKPGSAADTLILTNAGMAAATDSATPAPQGTSGSTKSYTVVAKPGTDLSKHVNHKIEVTGTVSASKPSSASSAQTSSAAAPPPTETLNVETFKMVAMACP